MTLQTVYDAVRRVTNTTTNSLPDATLLSLSNEAKNLIYQQLVDIREDFFGEISVTSLVNNQDEYPLPEDFYKLIRVELNYTDVEDDNDWVTATETDESPVGNPEWERTRENQSPASPIFNVYDQSIFVAPTFNLAPEQIQNNGLKIWYLPLVADFSAGIDVLAYPFNLCLKAFVQFMASEYFDSTGQTDRRDRAETKYEVEMNKAKDALRQVDISPVKTELPNNDGSNY